MGFDLSSPQASIMPGLLFGQVNRWLPAFATPFWMIALAILMAAAGLLIYFGVLAVLSYVPALGKLADDANRAVATSLVVGGLIGGALCMAFVPNASDPEFAHLLYVPLITIGIVLGFSTIYGMWHRTRSDWLLMSTEGPIPYLLSAAGLFVVMGLVALWVVKRPMDVVHSIPAVNLIGDGTTKFTVTVPGNGEANPDVAPFVPANQNYSIQNLAEVRIESNRKVFIGDSSQVTAFSRVPVEVNSDEPLVYRSTGNDEIPIPGDPSRMHIQNREVDPAKVTFSLKTRPRIPEASSVVTMALSVFVGIAFFFAFRQAAPRIWALAISTAKNEMGQPLFLLLMAIGLFAVILFGFFPFHTLGEDIRLFKDSCITIIMILGMLQTVWSAGTTVSEEIEGRTALTVLSKPVSRRSFVLGKYAGIMMAVLVLFVVIAVALLVVMSYKPHYDSRETTRAVIPWEVGYEEVVSTIPLLSLYFMQTMAIGAIAVALATRLPLLANFITCFAVYIIGNLTSPLVSAAEGNIPLVAFVGKLIAVIVPNLNAFNLQAAIDAAKPIPEIYLPGAFNYLVCFVIAIWMLAMLIFEDRDLA